ncbi:MAG TPA: methylated-DNA--[protein]-cysteine S-methyltransferase [Candidatus Hydrogenedentes bacterium]|nr:methylated-DNA--[protein]-cysteine S-methyltransferase [Candidatus Hydrogenedentota bacterium]HOV72893.1 methylated-DNA--[protein]-cysteine S-methyltransferase [Candidatus Hydrogenedentota bacterium]
MSASSVSTERCNFFLSFGRIGIAALISTQGVRWLELRAPNSDAEEIPPVTETGARLARLLEAYVAGECVDFDDIPLDLMGTPFQRAVWEGARTIPWGATESYAGLAARIGRPKAQRAVGRALGANPVPILVPCHRILAAQGRLGGFSAGLHWKQALLRIEGHAVAL